MVMAKNKGGLIVGILAGALMGVLFAPDKGKELRGKFVREIKDGGLGTKTISSNYRRTALNLLTAIQKILKSSVKSKKQTHE